jgi:DNA-binding GntR family transcriptional regulator
MGQVNSPPGLSRHLGTVSTVEALEGELERRILEGDLRAGEHLREIELAQQYEVGRNTLRAAFDSLVRRGLLVKTRHRGVFVRVLTAADLADIYELRTALEVQAASRLASRRLVPKQARDALARMRRLTHRSPRSVLVEADLAFHGAIVAGTGSARLARAHAEMQVEIRLCLAQLTEDYASVEVLGEQHQEILRAIEAGDVDAAEAAVRSHLEDATDWLVDHAAAGAKTSGPA